MARLAGVEPVRVASLDPKSYIGASSVWFLRENECGRQWQGLFLGLSHDGVSSVGTAFVPASIITKQNANTIGKNKDFIELFSMLGKDSVVFYLRHADALLCNPRVIEWP